jgi:prolyl oligopeptidase
MRRALHSGLSAIFLGVALLLQSEPYISGQSTPPVAPVHNVVDDYFGTKITDPYRWMEDMKSPEFQTWITAENDYTRSIIDPIPEAPETPQLNCRI